MIQFSACVAALFVALGSPPPVPDWSHAAGTAQASLGQAFAIDGLDVAISRIAPAARYPDGSLADAGAQLVAVDFWAHNPQTESVDFFERFYPYAELNDASNTDGEGVSFFPLTDSHELGDITLKPNDTVRASFFLEIPSGTSITALVIYGPVDGAKTKLNGNR